MKVLYHEVLNFNPKQEAMRVEGSANWSQLANIILRRQ